MSKKYISDNKRVILITGDQNKWYEQAIFIVRKSAGAGFDAKDLISEAEAIINNYLGAESPAPDISGFADKGPRAAAAREVERPKKKRRRGIDLFMNTLIVLVASGMLALLAHNFFG